MGPCLEIKSLTSNELLYMSVCIENAEIFNPFYWIKSSELGIWLFRFLIPGWMSPFCSSFLSSCLFGSLCLGYMIDFLSMYRSEAVLYL